MFRDSSPPYAYGVEDGESSRFSVEKFFSPCYTEYSTNNTKKEYFP